VIQSPRDKRRRTPAVTGSRSQFRKRDFRCARHGSRFTNKKPTCQGFRRWVGYNLVVKGFLQSWLFTHTRHSGPRRHLEMTTTGSGRWNKAIHNREYYAIVLDVSNHFFALALSVFSMIGTRVWLLPRVVVRQNFSNNFNFRITRDPGRIRKRMYEVELIATAMPT
jgi:hypothetical protein